MLKKVWFMLVLCSVLMVSGCSGGMPKDNMDSVAVSDDVVSDLIMAEAEQVETTVTEEQSEDSSNAETSNTEVRCLRLPSTYRRQNMLDMMQTVWQGLL